MSLLHVQCISEPFKVKKVIFKEKNCKLHFSRTLLKYIYQVFMSETVQDS
jgi:hypothetical protein